MLDFLQAALLPVSVQPRRLSLLMMTSVHMIIVNKEMLHYLLVHSWDSAPTNWLCGWSESVHENIEHDSFNRLYWWDVWTNWKVCPCFAVLNKGRFRFWFCFVQLFFHILRIGATLLWLVLNLCMCQWKAQWDLLTRWMNVVYIKIKCNFKSLYDVVH